LPIKLVLFGHIGLHMADQVTAADKGGAVDKKEHAWIGMKQEVLRCPMRSLRATALYEDWGILGIHAESVPV
jgi:hypothetical protein